LQVPWPESSLDSPYTMSLNRRFGKCDANAWEEQISMMEMVLDPEKLSEAVSGIRAQFSKYAL